MRRTRRRQPLFRRNLRILFPSAGLGLWLTMNLLARLLMRHWIESLAFFVGLLLYAIFLSWLTRRTMRELPARLSPEGLRNSMRPQSFCPSCGVLVEVCPACPRCGGKPPVHWGGPNTCMSCHHPVNSREEFRDRGLVWLCGESVARYQSHEVHPTWVVGILRLRDFQRLKGLPGAKFLRDGEVSLIYLPPRVGDEVALCAANMEDLPETGVVSRMHLLTGIQAVWLGAGGNRLDAHRALDRLQYLTALPADELQRLEILTEDPDPEPELRKAFALRLGPLTTGVSLETLRACRPEAAPVSVLADHSRIGQSAPELEQVTSLR